MVKLRSRVGKDLPMSLRPLDGRAGTRTGVFCPLALFCTFQSFEQVDGRAWSQSVVAFLEQGQKPF
jgi:hypothetical protein